MDHDDEPLRRLSAISATQDPGLRLRLHTGPARRELGRRLEEVTRRVHEATRGAVEVVRDTDPEPPATPTMTVVHRGRDVAHWLAVPEGPEEAPFIELLLQLAGPARVHPDRPDPPPPVTLTVFIAASCPSCPHQVRSATSLAAEDASLTVWIVDVELYPEPAQEVGVRSVPTTVADGGLTLVGVVAADELRRRVATARGPASEHLVLESLLQSGRTDAAAERLRTPAGRTAFADLWGTSTLETRIGLLLAAETALSEDETVLDPLVPALAAALDDPHPSRRGDTADLLGRIAHPSAAGPLRLHLRDPDPDVVEVVEEALTAIAGRAS